MVKICLDFKDPIKTDLDQLTGLLKKRLKNNTW